MPDDEEEAYLVDDDDSSIEADGDICDRCECLRDMHEDGIGECACKRCRKFKEP